MSETSNHAMQRTAGRFAFWVFDDYNLSLAARLALASGR